MHDPHQPGQLPETPDPGNDGKQSGTTTKQHRATPLRAALALLARRAHSTHELQTKLHQKGYTTEELTPALSRLRQLGLLDDQAFSSNFIESTTKRKPAGRYRLEQELRQRGIDDATIHEQLRDLDTTEACLRAARKKAKILTNPEEPRQRDRLIRFLQSRGFSWDDIRNALTQLDIQS